MKTLAFMTFLAAAARAAPPATDIKVDQAGYLPGLPQAALVVAKAAATDFLVKDSRSGATAFRGQLGVVAADADFGDRVQAADFSKLGKAGTYYLEVPGVGRSWDFEIAPNVYARGFYLALRSFYGQRCGTTVDLGPEFPAFKHEACHLTGAWHSSSGKSGTRESAKGWHDAGDYGRYMVDSGLSIGALLWAYEMFAPRLKGAGLNIPESGNALPDMLDEIRWNLDWMLSMQDEDGGVFHKQTSERFRGFAMPEKDTFVSYVMGAGREPCKSTCATADFAAVMALAARAYKPFDPACAARTLKAARAAYAWVEKYPAVMFANPQGVNTGGYGDRSCGDERLWAAAELWRSTGDAACERYFLENYVVFRSSLRATNPMSWPNVAPMGLWAYALGKGKGATAAAAIVEDSRQAAEEIATRTGAAVYRNSMTTREYIWGSNSVAANYGVQLLVADRLAPNPRFVAAAAGNLHYLRGRNAFSMSWVTQLGANPFRHPHHRPSGADGVADPWPGLLSGGPNGRKRDPAMQKMPDLPPAKMYLDEQASYASNETAINWNAPLVFLLAGLLQAGK